MRQAVSRKKKTGIPFWIWAAVTGALLIAAAIGWAAAHFDDPGPVETTRVTLPVLHGLNPELPSGKNTSPSGKSTAASSAGIPTLPTLFVIGTAGSSSEKETSAERPPESTPPRTEERTTETLPETPEETTPAPTEPPTAPPTAAPTQPPTTQAPTEPPTTQVPTTQAPTEPPTTQAPTEPPSTAPSTTEAPTTEAPTTEPPTTEPETTPEETVPEPEGARVWIGDSRMTGVRMYVTWDAEKDRFIDKVGEGIGWFQTEAIPALKAKIEEETVIKVFINMGVNDCAATYKQDYGTRAAAYSELINALIDEYPEIRFFFCSVGPSNGEWYNTVEIAKLNEEVNRFNEEMAALCRAAYIDSGEYLKRTGFATLDGIHYNIPTYQRWYEYVLSQSQ